MSADSWKEMEEWVHCIRESSKITVNKSELNPHRVSIVGSYTTEVVAGNVIHTPTAPVSSNSSYILS